MKTIFTKKEAHRPKYFLIDANGKTLGRLATEISKLLRGKDLTYCSPGVDQGNYVAVINSEKIVVSGRKENQKLYYRPTQRPGNLKVETYSQVKKRFPSRILEKAVWGMLPKGVLGRQYYRRLFIYSGSELVTKKIKDSNTTIEWISK